MTIMEAVLIFWPIVAIFATPIVGLYLWIAMNR